MGGGGGVPVPGRTRIKGRSGSAIRFFLIAVSFAMPWVLITSEAVYYYSLWFGPQILLELTLAFYVPSIPILIISGQIEGVLDASIGPTASMAGRLMVGLAGCTVVTALFPFVPATHTSLLALVALLGTMSSIAFSTSYQLVQWFRHADIIALGLGGVGTGPMVLLMQLVLDVGPLPERWQWVAMFEATAAMGIVGILAAVSLFVQYWKIMSGVESYEDPRTPLLVTEQQAQADAQEEGAMLLARAATARILLTPDPFGSLPMLNEGSLCLNSDAVLRRPTLLHRCNSIGSCNNLPGLPQGYHMLDHPSMPPHLPSPMSSQEQESARRATRCHSSKQGRAPLYAPPALPDPLPSASSPHGLERERAALERSRLRHMQQAGEVGLGGGGGTQSLDLAVPQGHQGWGSGEERPGPNMVAYASAFLDPALQQQLLQHGDIPAAPPRHGADPAAAAAAAAAAASGASGGAEGAEGGRGVPRKLSVHEENALVVRAIWQVLVAFPTSVTVLYLVFPFFTYVPSSGLLGPKLPQVLFYSRIFADLVGRFAPRRKALMVRSSTSLLIMALGKVVLATLFFLYIKSPARFHSDVFSVGLVAVLWLVGGYMNTSANILAPSLVDVSLIGRTSAILALLFQVAHFAGLLLAVALAIVLYGDVVG